MPGIVSISGPFTFNDLLMILARMYIKNPGITPPRILKGDGTHKSKPEVRLMRGRRILGAESRNWAARLRVPKAAFWALLAASNPHFCRELVLKSTPEVRLKKGAEF